MASIGKNSKKTPTRIGGGEEKRYRELKLVKIKIEGDKDQV